MRRGLSKIMARWWNSVRVDLDRRPDPTSNRASRYCYKPAGVVSNAGTCTTQHVREFESERLAAADGHGAQTDEMQDGDAAQGEDIFVTATLARGSPGGRATQQVPSAWSSGQRLAPRAR
jgi:hypothetical protein